MVYSNISILHNSNIIHSILTFNCCSNFYVLFFVLFFQEKVIKIFHQKMFVNLCHKKIIFISFTFLSLIFLVGFIFYKLSPWNFLKRKQTVVQDIVFVLLTAILVTAILTDTVGRKWLQAIGFFVMGVFFALLLLCTSSRLWTTIFLFGVRCFAAVADIGGYIYTPEVFYSSFFVFVYFYGISFSNFLFFCFE